MTNMMYPVPRPAYVPTKVILPHTYQMCYDTQVQFLYTFLYFMHLSQQKGVIYFCSLQHMLQDELSTPLSFQFHSLSHLSRCAKDGREMQVETCQWKFLLAYRSFQLTAVYFEFQIR